MLTQISSPFMHDTAYEQERADTRPHAIVIGSGFGGLAAAIRLGARGYRVTVLEKGSQPGGRAAVFQQDGFTFDAGPTIVTAPFLFEELWAMCGRKMTEDVVLKPMFPFYRLIFPDGEVMDCSGDEAAMAAEVTRLAPHDLPGYQRLMAESEAIYKVGFEQLGHIPFSTPMDMARAIPAMARLRADRSLYSLVAKRVKDWRLRIALSFHPLFIGGNPFTVTSIYALVIHLERKYGVHYALGGTGQLVKGLVGLLQGQGGRLRLNAEVSEILIENGVATGVQLTTGEHIRAQIVVSNACAGYTEQKLIPPHIRRGWLAKNRTKGRYSMSVFVWYFGTKRRYEDVEHHTILLGPRYKELLDDIFSKKVLAEDFSLYLHRPSASDPSVAPEGCDAFYVLSPVPNLTSGTNWAEEGEHYRKKIEAALEATLLPGLSGEIVTSRFITPDYFKDDLLSLHGAAFGIEPILTQSAWFRPHNRVEGVENLFLVGAGTHPGAGMPGVLSSARVLDLVVPHASTFA